MMEIIEEQVAEVEEERRAVRREAALMGATLALAFFVVLFVAEPSVDTGLMVMGSMLGYAAVAGWVALTDRLRCTKRVG